MNECLGCSSRRRLRLRIEESGNALCRKKERIRKGAETEQTYSRREEEEAFLSLQPAFLWVHPKSEEGRRSPR